MDRRIEHLRNYNRYNLKETVKISKIGPFYPTTHATLIYGLSLCNCLWSQDQYSWHFVVIQGQNNEKFKTLGIMLPLTSALIIHRSGISGSTQCFSFTFFWPPNALMGETNESMRHYPPPFSLYFLATLR